MQAVPSLGNRDHPARIIIPNAYDPRMDHLRELRAEVQDLHSVLEKVRKGETTVKFNAEYIRKTQKDLEGLISQIQDGDAIRHVENVYEQMIRNPLFANPENELDVQSQLHALNLLEDQIQKIEFHVGYLTIPARVNDWLAQARPGYYIPFHAVFEDEVPEAEDRAKILNYLAWAPKAILGGIVDATNGLIYRYSENPWARAGNILFIVGTLMASTAVIIGACYLPAPGWLIHPDNLSSFVVGWGAILIGVIVHVGVGSVKRSQSQGSLPPITSLGDLPLIIDAKSGQIIMKILLALIGFFGLAFASGLDQVTPLNTFLVGYGLDSFVGIFGTGIEQRAAAQAESLKKQLGVTSD